MRRAGHLYRRAGFGAAWNELQRALADGPQRTIDRLLHPGHQAEAFNRAHDEYELSAIDPAAASSDTLRQWWLRRMLETPHPLLEKMTLFWHQHFATAGARVHNARLMQRYLQLLRSHGLGRLVPLMVAVTRDPATLLSLDVGANYRSRPSENLARALLEHFTVGPGAFTGQDVREAARAFTGWSVLTRQLRYLEHQHDSGVKTILGQQGNWSGEDAVRIALQHPATAPRLVRKLYRWFISEADEPGEALIAPLAQLLAKDGDIGKLVETMLRSNLFFSPIAYRRRIKSPVEFALSIVRPFETLVPTAPLGHALNRLGQDLCEPPTLDGWEGGQTWITSATLLERHNLAVALLGGGEPFGDKLDPSALAEKHGHHSAESAGRFFVDLFLQGDLEDAVREKLLKGAGTRPASPPSAARYRQMAQAIVTLPEFQLA